MIASKRLLICISIALVLAIISVFSPAIIDIMILFDLIIVAIIMTEATWLWLANRQITVSVHGDTIWSRNRPQAITYHIHCSFKRGKLSARCRGDWPRGIITSHPEMVPTELAPRKQVSINIEATGHQRGSFSSRGLYIETRSPLGFYVFPSMLRCTQRYLYLP